MNITQHHSGGTDIAEDEQPRDKGFTLVEILIAMVLIGILSAVVVVGISNLTSKGSKSACVASKDAAQAGSVIYYSQAGNVYPATLLALTQPITAPAPAPAALTLPSEVTVTAEEPNVAKAGSWALTMTPGGRDGAGPTFACTP